MGPIQTIIDSEGGWGVEKSASVHSSDTEPDPFKLSGSMFQMEDGRDTRRSECRDDVCFTRHFSLP